MKRLLSVFLLSFTLLLWDSSIYAVPVDLSTFVAEPDDPSIVNIGSDMITFTEDQDYGYIYAANDSFVVPGDATVLTFDYQLTLGQDDYDWLVAIIEYTDYVMEIGQSGSGSYTIDLTPYQGNTISLAFGLEYDWLEDEGFDSIGTISNIDVALAPVPEPGTVILLGTGLVGLFGFGRKKFLTFLNRPDKR